VCRKYLEMPGMVKGTGFSRSCRERGGDIKREKGGFFYIRGKRSGGEEGNLCNTKGYQRFCTHNSARATRARGGKVKMSSLLPPLTRGLTVGEKEKGGALTEASGLEVHFYHLLKKGSKSEKRGVGATMF